MNLKIMATQVVTNGYFTFDGYIGYNPRYIVYNTAYIRTIVAPFFTDIDISGGVGNIEYEIHTNTTSETILSQVNEFINNCSGKNFSGEWLLVASWEAVPLFYSNPTNVSL